MPHPRWTHFLTHQALPSCAAELLDPLLPLLVRALRSRHAPSVTTALQALTLLMQSQLPGLSKTAAGKGSGLAWALSPLGAAVLAGRLGCRGVADCPP